MAYLHDQMEGLKWDVRMKEINIKNRRVTRAELEQKAQALPDLRDQAKNLDFDERSFSREARRQSRG